MMNRPELGDLSWPTVYSLSLSLSLSIWTFGLGCGVESVRVALVCLVLFSSAKKRKHGSAQLGNVPGDTAASSWFAKS
jgi:hypothetical protein